MQRSTSIRIDGELTSKYKEAVRKLAAQIQPVEIPGFMKVNVPKPAIQPNIAYTRNKTSNGKTQQRDLKQKSEDQIREELGLRQRGGVAPDKNGGNLYQTSVQESLQNDLIEDLGNLVSDLKQNVTLVNNHITSRGQQLDSTHHKLDANVERAKKAKSQATQINIKTSMGLCQRLKLVLLMLFVLGLMAVFMVSNKVMRRVLWLN
eukprot:TRINITY_DN11550_c0_g1_i12.p1 TRINITY_DN11550_c0_g1~~TRINITY_DN11550_c0_g1_i12.p1  ORF type:complete len:205 (+),score=17.63 TRINITY_DN11550_c0_g1_i12:126-740(+)